MSEHCLLMWETALPHWNWEPNPNTHQKNISQNVLIFANSDVILIRRETGFHIFKNNFIYISDRILTIFSVELMVFF